MTEKSAIAKSTLYRTLCAIADEYPLADVLETLAHIAQERRWEKTATKLDEAVDLNLEERQ